MSDDAMFNQATRTARHGLATAFAQHPLVANARVTCNQSPLQVQGTFTDGSQFLFSCRHGIAELGRSVNHTEPTTLRTHCPEGINVDDIQAAETLLHTLIDAHGLAPDPTSGKCEHCGSPVHYDSSVDALLSNDNNDAHCPIGARHSLPVTW